MTEAVRRAGRWARIRAKLTYANVMSTIAAFLGLGGGSAYAVEQLRKDSVGSKQLQRKSVGTSELKDSAVTGRKVKNRSLGAGELSFVALRLGDILTSPVFLTNDLPGSSSFATIASTSLSLASRSRLLAEGDVNVTLTKAADTGTVSFRLVVDGTPLPGEFIDGLEGDVAAGRKISSMSFSANLGPGNHTIQLQAKTDVGSVVIGTRSFDAVAYRD
jgi:hypothetical protein